MHDLVAFKNLDKIHTASFTLPLATSEPGNSSGVHVHRLAPAVRIKSQVEAQSSCWVEIIGKILQSTDEMISFSHKLYLGLK